jgi:hypothetical protein
VGDDLAILGGRVFGVLAPVGPLGKESPAPKNGLEAGAGLGILYDMARELRDDLAKTNPKPRQR